MSAQEQELQDIISPKFTEQTLFDIIKKKSGLSDIKVKKIKIGTASKKGDSYMSNVCRFKVEATGKNSTGQEEFTAFPVFVKYLPKNIARRKTYRTVDFFENETIFFEKVWPVFQQFQESINVPNKFDNIPIVLSACCDGVNDYIAMLDLNYDGYDTVERGAGLDYDHTIAILQTLGRFHALSLAMKNKQPEIFERAVKTLKETYCAEKLRNWYTGFQNELIEVVRDAVEKELPPSYLHKFNKLVGDDLYGAMCKFCEVRGPLSVVTHGDVWVPNFLIKYDASKKIQHIVIIDFQLARYTTLGCDITFFLYSCVDPNLLDTKLDDLIAQYHKGLADGLESYGCDKNLVTIEDIHTEIKTCNKFGIGMSIEGVIMSLLGDDEVSDLDDIQGTEAVPIQTLNRVSLFKEQEKRRRIANMIKFSVDKNFM